MTDKPEADLGRIGATLARRSTLEHRAVVTGENRTEIMTALAALAEERDARNLIQGVAVTPGKIGFLFTGQGSQRPGMGKQLYQTFGVFAEALDEICGHFDMPIREIMFAEDDERLHQTGFTQPALFALEVALYRLIRSCGVTPAYLMGHSIGEVAAAHVAGVFSLEDACKLVQARGRLMQELPAGGGMLSVRAGESDVLPLLDGLTDRVGIAATNSPRSTVVSGDEDVLLELAERCADLGWKTKRLEVSHAFHSPRMAGMLDDFRLVAKDITYAAPTIPVISNLTGELAGSELVTDPEYWVRHVREAVRFVDGVRCMREQGVTTYVELGPDAVLTGLTHECLEQVALVPLSQRRKPEARTALAALAQLHTRGVRVDFAPLLPAAGEPGDVPTYPFQRQRFWLDPVKQTTAGTTTDAEFWAAVHTQDLTAFALSGDEEAALRAVLPALTAWRRQQDSHYKVTYQPVTGQVGGEQVFVRSSGTYVRRLVRVAAKPEPAWSPQGTVLVTGTGALAGAAARWMARNGAAHIVLDGDAVDLEAELIALGAEVSVVTSDLTDRAVMAGVLTAQAPTAVVDTTGATGWLDLLTGQPVAVFTTDLLEQPPDRDGLFVTLPNGPGIQPMNPDLAATVLARMGEQGTTEMVLADVDWDRFPALPLFSGIPETAAACEVQQQTEQLGDLLVAASPEEQEQILVDFVRTQASAALGHDSPDTIDLDQNFMELGFSSFTALELVSSVNTATGLTISASDVFDHPTPAALVRHLHDQLNTNLAA